MIIVKPMTWWLPIGMMGKLWNYGSTIVQLHVQRHQRLLMADERFEGLSNFMSGDFSHYSMLWLCDRGRRSHASVWRITNKIPHLVQPVKLGDWRQWFSWWMCTNVAMRVEKIKKTLVGRFLAELGSFLDGSICPRDSSTGGRHCSHKLRLNISHQNADFFCQPKGTGGLPMWTHQSWAVDRCTRDGEAHCF